MIDTGGTIVQAAQALKDNGAQEVFACCTHGCFPAMRWRSLKIP
jgi:ribose-phosphate pyrophosphokinase